MTPTDDRLNRIERILETTATRLDQVSEQQKSTNTTLAQITEQQKSTNSTLAQIAEQQKSNTAAIGQLTQKVNHLDEDAQASAADFAHRIVELWEEAERDRAKADQDRAKADEDRAFMRGLQTENRRILDYLINRNGGSSPPS